MSDSPPPLHQPGREKPIGVAIASPRIRHQTTLGSPLGAAFTASSPPCWSHDGDTVLPDAPCTLIWGLDSPFSPLQWLPPGSPAEEVGMDGFWRPLPGGGPSLSPRESSLPDPHRPSALPGGWGVPEPPSPLALQLATPPVYFLFL